MADGDTLEEATFAAGCFWGVEAAFAGVRGVTATEVGYTGGRTGDPDYREVCSGTTGHAEAVHVTFDPRLVSYRGLLGVFWKVHDPTTKNRQGPDIGEQYRSAIFFHTPAQEKEARESIRALLASPGFRGPVTTEVLPAGRFWRAEEYHQQYFQKTGARGCHLF